MLGFVKKSLFKVLVIVLLLNLTKLFLPSDYAWGNRQFINKKEYIINNNGTFNTYFFGSSRINRHIDPKLFDKEISLDSIHSFNMGATGTFAPQSYYLFERFLEEIPEDKIKYAFVELSDFQPIFPQNISSDKRIYEQNGAKFKFLTKSLINNQEIKTKNKLFVIGSRFLTLIQKPFQFKQYRSLFINVKKQDLDILGPNKDGFMSLEYRENSTKDESVLKDLQKRKQKLKTKDLENWNKEATIAFKAKKGKLDSIHHHKLMELINLAKDKNVKLIYIFCPRKVSKNLVTLYDSLPSANKIELANPEENWEFYDAEYTYDKLHFNDKGVALFTRRLADRFNKLEAIE